MKLSTVFILSVLVFILFFDLWVENSPQAQNLFDYWIKPFTDEPHFSIVWTILLLAAMIVVIKDILENKELEKKELENTLKSEMSILVSANKELNHYRLQDHLTTILNRFVQQNPYVNAAQWYHYIENNFRGKTNFKLNFQYGSAAEGVNLNAIQQLYFTCETSTLKDFRDAKSAYGKGNPELLVNLIIKINKRLLRKGEDELTQEDAVLYSIMLLSFELIERDFDIVFDELSNFSLNKRRVLIDHHRTGIFRAALMEDEYYSFTHTRENDKHNRQYIARLIKVREENIVFTIVLDSSVLDEDEYETVMLNIAKDFERLLNDLEIMYTKNIDEDGD